MGVKVGFRKKEKGCSGGTIVGCGPDGHVGHGGSVGRCIASGCFEEDSMDFMPGIIHITVLAPSKKNRSAVRAIITHQPFCALSCCIVFCSHRFPMQAACAACFSLYPSVFLLQSISLYLLMRSVSYLQRLRKDQSTATRLPAQIKRQCWILGDKWGEYQTVPMLCNVFLMDACFLSPPFHLLRSSCAKGSLYKVTP